MNRLSNLGLGLVLVGAVLANASADDIVSESRAVDARVVRVKLDGDFDLTLKQGPSPSLTIIGDKRWIQKISTVQNGDTLHIDTQARGFKIGRTHVRAQLTLPALTELSSEGVGAIDVSGFSGERLELALEGAGTMKVLCSYKNLEARLGGVGSMNIQAGDSDMVDLDMQGAGYITLAGRSRSLKVNLGGLGGLDAQYLQVENVNLELSGLGSATVTARQNAVLNLSGMGSVTVYGKPVRRNVSVDGLGKVSWK